MVAGDQDYRTGGYTYPGGYYTTTAPPCFKKNCGACPYRDYCSNREYTVTTTTTTSDTR